MEPVDKRYASRGLVPEVVATEDDYREVGLCGDVRRISSPQGAVARERFIRHARQELLEPRAERLRV
jgi:hypothetical protein